MAGPTTLGPSVLVPAISGGVIRTAIASTQWVGLPAPGGIQAKTVLVSVVSTEPLATRTHQQDAAQVALVDFNDPANRSADFGMTITADDSPLLLTVPDWATSAAVRWSPLVGQACSVSIHPMRQPNP